MVKHGVRKISSFEFPDGVNYVPGGDPTEDAAVGTRASLQRRSAWRATWPQPPKKDSAERAHGRARELQSSLTVQPKSWSRHSS